MFLRMCRLAPNLQKPATKKEQTLGPFYNLYLTEIKNHQEENYSPTNLKIKNTRREHRVDRTRFQHYGITHMSMYTLVNNPYGWENERVGQWSKWINHNQK